MPADGPGGRALYNFDKTNFAPRLALAWAPQNQSGLTRVLFGKPGQSSLRLGAGMYYELFGMGLMRELDENALGLSSTLLSQGGLTLETAPRFAGVNQLPGSLIIPAPPGGPGQAPDIYGGGFGVDHDLRTPYTINLNASYQRDLGRGFTLDLGYVGRLSRRSLVRLNAAATTNFHDPDTGMTFWEAAQPLAAAAGRQAPTESISPIPFWENLWSNAATDGMTATQAAYQAYLNSGSDWGFAISNLDVYCRPACSRLGPYLMSSPQYWGISTLSSHGFGDYQALQTSLRKRFSDGVQFDVNYTWSKSIDLSTVGERAGGADWFVTNAWDRSQNRGVSDFDMTHQLNANWVVELPVGRGRHWLSDASPVLDAVLGGWQISGIGRVTSGLPLNIHARGYPIDWSNIGRAVSLGVAPEQRTTLNARFPNGLVGPSAFPDPAAAHDLFREPLPGESGQRNSVRGDGLFSVDMGLGKRFALPLEGHSVQLRAEVFNATNSTSFLAARAGRLGQVNNFGRYTQTMVPARVWQFGLRYDF